MTNVSLTAPSPTNTKQKNHTMDPPLDFCSLLWSIADIQGVVSIIFICVVCTLGLLGNGTVIWLLSFRMKRNPITTYILNLAVADFGVLISIIFSVAMFFLIVSCDQDFTLALFLYTAGLVLFYFMFSVSQFLLTIISIDRCVCVLFPMYYRFHRPEKLSTILCALIWVFCFLVYGTFYPLDFWGVFGQTQKMLYVLLVFAALSLPLITISSLILVIRFCFKTQQRHRKKLFMAVLLALFFFLFLAFPLNIKYLRNFLPSSHHDVFYIIQSDFFSVGYLCASVNSFVNPLIYFLVGRKKRGLCRENLKLILQRVFKQEEEEVCGEELQPSTPGTCITP